MLQDKSLIRKQLLHCRQLLAQATYESRCKKITEKVLSVGESSNSQSLHTFLPIEKNREVDTSQIIRNCIEKGNQVIISATDFKNREMTHFIYDENIRLQNDQMGIPTPISGSQTDLNNLDMILVPLLGVDKKGHRIGYGGGYYDRLLSGLAKKVLKVGLSLGTPFDQFKFVDPHDIALDIIITPFETLKIQ